MNIEIYPLDKVIFDGNPVYLGMEQFAVESIIGKGQLIGKRYYYFNNEMAIDYSQRGTVEFIEFLGGIEGTLRPVIYDVSAFDVDADELVELLKQKNAGEVMDPEQGHLYSFVNISVGLYRELRPEDVLEMIEFMKADGIPTEGNEDVAADMKRASHWGTIGVGVAGYYQRY